MKTILLAAALALTATTASAGPVKLPKEYLGSWCITFRKDTDIWHERCDPSPIKERTVVGPTTLFNSAMEDCNRLIKSELSPPYGSDRTYFMTYQCKSGTLTIELYLMKDGTLRLSFVKKSDR